MLRERWRSGRQTRGDLSSSSCSASRVPFLNSVKLDPSDRMTEGSRLPNSSSTITAKIINSGKPMWGMTTSWQDVSRGPEAACRAIIGRATHYATQRVALQGSGLAGTAETAVGCRWRGLREPDHPQHRAGRVVSTRKGPLESRRR